MNKFIKILPENDLKDPGWRFRLSLSTTGMAVLANEKTLPEHVNNENANLVEAADLIWLKRDEAQWLYDSLGELLHGWNDDE
jgi:hypothetical protein